MEQLQAAVAEVERLGEQFLANKAQIVEADKQRQANREALAALRRAVRLAAPDKATPQPQQQQQQTEQEPQRKAWLMMPAAAAGGPATFAKHTASDAVARLEAEQERLDRCVAALRAEQKRLTAELAERGAGPDEARPGLVRAMLTLRGDGSSGGGGKGGDEDDGEDG